MKKTVLFVAPLLFIGLTPTVTTADHHEKDMSFFITSHGPGNGADLGGLEGADAHCQSLAEEAGSSGKTWRAYLSTQMNGGNNARDRIGSGPWYNAKGVEVASSVDDLHSDNNKLNKENSLTEWGKIVNGRGDSPNMHDILTGSTLMGMMFEDGENHTCQDYSSHGDGSAQVGHHDRNGGGANPTSWNAAHGSRGCSQANLEATGGKGFYYCFAEN